MASMKYYDKHNQVGFLKKPEESAGFAEIVDFLKGSHIRYALTHNLTIHDSLVKQFWQTTTASTLADETLELRETIDTLEYTITKALLQRSRSVDMGKRYKRRKESKGKDINTSFEYISTGFEDISTGFEKVNTGGLGVSTGRDGQKEKLKKQRKVQVQFKAQHYTEEDWDAIRAKLEANAELTKNVLGKELPEEDFAKKMVESFVPMNIEATKAQLKRYGEELQTEISKKQRIDDKDVSVEEKVTEVKEEEPVIRIGKRKKQKAKKGINVWTRDHKDYSRLMKEKRIYQIIRANGADTVYMSFRAMLKDFTREDLIELYRTKFDPPLNEDAIWSLPLQQKIIS
ncbi:hypothetical protein Tco_0588274 [Tanacetum coccineum]